MASAASPPPLADLAPNLIPPSTAALAFANEAKNGTAANVPAPVALAKGGMAANAPPLVAPAKDGQVAAVSMPVDRASAGTANAALAELQAVPFARSVPVAGSWIAKPTDAPVAEELFGIQAAAAAEHFKRSLNTSGQ